MSGGKWDLWAFGEGSSESCKPRGGGQGPTTSFPSFACTILITFSGKPLLIAITVSLKRCLGLCVSK